MTKEESDLQVRLYSICFESLGKKVVLGSIANPEENEIRDLSIDKKELAAAKEIAEKATGGVLANEFHPIPAGHCRTCDFKNICKAGAEYLLKNPDK